MSELKRCSKRKRTLSEEEPKHQNQQENDEVDLNLKRCGIVLGVLKSEVVRYLLF